MYCFNLYYHAFFVIVLAQYILGLNFTDSLPQMENNTINRFNIQQRHRRQFISIFSDNYKPQIKVSDHGTLVINNNTQSSSVQSETWLKLIRSQSGRVMEGATDMVLTPVNWFKHVLDYW